MFLSAFAALHDPASRSYYDRCRARGKTHTQALLRLARHRISVLFAMLRDGTFYQPRSPPHSLTKNIEAPRRTGTRCHRAPGTPPWDGSGGPVKWPRRHHTRTGESRCDSGADPQP
ncbi:hypothetical protein GCM10020256_54520 [Streptomyces thermocoprophilus]